MLDSPSMLAVLGVVSKTAVLPCLVVSGSVASGSGAGRGSVEELALTVRLALTGLLDVFRPASGLPLFFFTTLIRGVLRLVGEGFVDMTVASLR